MVLDEAFLRVDLHAKTSILGFAAERALGSIGLAAPNRPAACSAA